jgi:hypothetical protein
MGDSSDDEKRIQTPMSWIGLSSLAGREESISFPEVKCGDNSLKLAHIRLASSFRATLRVYLRSWPCHGSGG